MHQSNEIFLKNKQDKFTKRDVSNLDQNDYLRILKESQARFNFRRFPKIHKSKPNVYKNNINSSSSSSSSSNNNLLNSNVMHQSFLNFKNDLIPNEMYEKQFARSPLSSSSSKWNYSYKQNNYQHASESLLRVRHSNIDLSKY